MRKSEFYGLLGSTLSSVILLFCLWFVVLKVPKLTENEGFLVSFGDSFDAGGMGNEAPTASEKPAESTKNEANATKIQTEPKSKPDKQQVFTQTENSVSIAEQKEKERVKRELENVKAQQIETNKRIADQNRKEQEAIEKAKSVDGLFSNGGSGGGSGSAKGTGTGKGSGAGSGAGIQGNPAGKGSSGVGFTLNLGNRNYFGNPVKPNYPKDVEGKITVNIRVDENGVVSSTSIGSPTTISDSEMRKDAMSAANRTRFTAGKNTETGSITYNYRLQ